MAFIKITAKVGAGSVAIGDVILATLFGVAGSPAAETALKWSGHFANSVIEIAENGARHLHEAPREEERENLHGEAENNASRRGGRSNKSKAKHVRGAEEEAEEWIEDEHTDEELTPLGKPFLGVW